MTKHIEQNGPPKSNQNRQNPNQGKREGSEGDRRSRIDGKRNNLVCSHRCIPLKFVSCSKDTGYEDSVKEFRDLLMQHGNFGNEGRGFSLPEQLFHPKDRKDESFIDYTNYQFDLKREEGYYYVTLRSIEDSKNEDDDEDDHELTSNGTQSNHSFDNCDRRTAEKPAELRKTPQCDDISEQGFCPIKLELDSSDGAPERDSSDYKVDDNDREVQYYFPEKAKTDSPEITATRRAVDTPRLTGQSTSTGLSLSGPSRSLSVTQSDPMDGTVRRSSQFSRLDDAIEPDKIPNFWLILEISSVLPDDLPHELEEFQSFELEPSSKFHVDLPSKIPVVKLYHHRRTSDEPQHIKVDGEPISFGTNIREETGDTREGTKTADRKDGLRDRNLIDADDTFIRQIEKYITNLVRRVNQQHLLQRLSETKACHEILVASTYDGFGEMEEQGDTQETRFGHFRFLASEFEPSEPIWVKSFQLHPRIARARKDGVNAAVAGLKKKFRPLTITNRENMFLWLDESSQNFFYFFINREEIKPRSWGDHVCEKSGPHRSISTDSEDGFAFAYTRQSASEKPVRRASIASVSSVPDKVKTPTSNHIVHISMYGICDGQTPTKSTNESLAKFEKEIENVIHSTTLKALTEIARPTMGDYFTHHDVHFIQPREQVYIQFLLIPLIL